MKNKRVLCLLLTFVICLSVPSGCQSGGESVSSSEDASASGTADGQPPMEISVAIWNAEQTITTPAEDPVYRQICDTLGIILVPSGTTWDDYEQKIQVWASTDQLPDVFAVDAYRKPYYPAWVKEGIIKALPDDLSAYPYLEGVYDDPQYEAVRHGDGRFYCVPRSTYSEPRMFCNEKALLIRRDWMEAGGYTRDPESLEEMIAMLQDLSENNPEKKKDVVGVTCFDYSFILWFMYPYNSLAITGYNPWAREDGKWTNTLLQSGTRDGVAALGKMWREGVIDRNLATLKEDEGLDKFASGYAVAYAYGGYPSALQIVAERFKITYPDKPFSELVKIVRPWKNADGNRYYAEQLTWWSESYINGNVDDAKFDRILRLFDYLLSPEGLRLMRYGIEGVDYEIVNGEINVLREAGRRLAEDYAFLDEGANFLATWDQDFMYESPLYEPYIHTISNDMLDWYWQGIGDSVFQDFRNSVLVTPMMNAFNVLMADDILVSMTSKDAGAEWDKIIQRYLDDGYGEVVEDFNREAISRGIIP